MTQYYLLTILKGEELYANVYASVEELKEEYASFGKKYLVRSFVLDDAEPGENPVYLAQVRGKWILCIGPKEEVPSEYVACKREEIDLEHFETT